VNLHGKSVLVTGGAGFIGSHIVDRLIQLDCEVMVLDDLSNGASNNLSQALDSGRCELVRASVTDRDAVRNAVEGKDVVFHQAALNYLMSIEDPVRDLNVNSLGTLRLLQACEESDSVKVLVYASTGSVYGNPERVPQVEDDPLLPTSPYGISKLAAEKYVTMWSEVLDFPTVSLRYHNVYGPRQAFHETGGVIPIFIRRASAGKPLRIDGDGQQQRSFTYVDDVVSANLAAASTESAWGGVYNVGHVESTSVLELARMVLKLVGSSIELDYAPGRIGEIDIFRPDLTRAKEYLGYEPTVPLSEGLRRVLNWAVETGQFSSSSIDG
jgi:UDP-glucose 4-epimerase